MLLRKILSPERFEMINSYVELILVFIVTFFKIIVIYEPIIVIDMLRKLTAIKFVHGF